MDFSLVIKYWPIIAACSLGLVGFGSLKSDVGHIQQQQDIASNDHDRIVRIEERQEQLQKDVSEMKKDIKSIAEAVKD